MEKNGRQMTQNMEGLKAMGKIEKSIPQKEKWFDHEYHSEIEKQPE